MSSYLLTNIGFGPDWPCASAFPQAKLAEDPSLLNTCSGWLLDLGRSIGHLTQKAVGQVWIVPKFLWHVFPYMKWGTLYIYDIKWHRFRNASFGWILANSNRMVWGAFLISMFFFGLGWLTCGCARHYDCRIHGGGCHQLALAERLGVQAELVNLSSVGFEALVRSKPRNLQVLIAMAKFERSLSNNDLNKSMMQKIFLAQTLNIGTLDIGVPRCAWGQRVACYVQILKMTLESHTHHPKKMGANFPQTG